MSQKLKVKGYWYESAVLTNAHNKMQIVQEENFGPIVPVVKISSFEEGLGLEKFIRQPSQLESGCALAPERPEHGVEFDLETLETHRLE